MNYPLIRISKLKNGPSSAEVEKTIHDRVNAAERAWLHEKSQLQNTVKTLKVAQSELEAQNEQLMLQKSSFEERLSIEKDEWQKEKSKLTFELSRRPKGPDQSSKPGLGKVCINMSQGPERAFL